MNNAAFEQIISIEMIHNVGTVKRNGIEINPDDCQKNDVVIDDDGNEYTITNRDGDMVTIVKHTASSTQSARAAVSKGGMKKRRAYKRHTKKRHTKKHRTHKRRARK